MGFYSKYTYLFGEHAVECVDELQVGGGCHVVVAAHLMVYRCLWCIGVYGV
jgi:hypothetical protein